MAASKTLTKKDALSELAFSGRHAKQSLWVHVQKYNKNFSNVSDVLWCNAIWALANLELNRTWCRLSGL